MGNTNISIKKQKIFEKFKQQIRNKKQLKLVKIKLYLKKMKEELQTPKTKNIEIQTLQLSNESNCRMFLSNLRLEEMRTGVLRQPLNLS